MRQRLARRGYRPDDDRRGGRRDCRDGAGARRPPRGGRHRPDRDRVRGRGRLRVKRQIEARASARRSPSEAIDEVFARRRLRRAAERRSRTAAARPRPRSPTTVSSSGCTATCVAQGFETDRVLAALARGEADAERVRSEPGSDALSQRPLTVGSGLASTSTMLDDLQGNPRVVPRLFSSGTATASSPARRSSRTTTRRCSSPTPG